MNHSSLQYITICLCATALIGSPLFARAEERSVDVKARIEASAKNRQDMQLRAEVNKEASSEARTNAHSSNRNPKSDRNIPEQAQIKIRAIATRHIEKTEARLVRIVKSLENISIRLRTRIEKFEEQGKDMTKPKELFVKASSEIQVAKIAVAEFKITAEAKVSAEETVSGKMQALREVTKGVQEKIRSAHKALVDVVVSIKGNVKAEGELSATTEASSN